MMSVADDDSKAKPALENAVRAINSAQTLQFRGRRLHAAAPTYGLDSLKDVVTRQTYYSWNDAGRMFIRVESSVTVLDRTIATIFLKNPEGIWEILPQYVCEVSAIFTHDQLLGTFPFLRLSLTVQYPYELHLDE